MKLIDAIVQEKIKAQHGWDTVGVSPSRTSLHRKFVSVRNLLQRGFVDVFFVACDGMGHIFTDKSSAIDHARFLRDRCLRQGVSVRRVTL